MTVTVSLLILFANSLISRTNAVLPAIKDMHINSIMANVYIQIQKRIQTVYFGKTINALIATMVITWAIMGYAPSQIPIAKLLIQRPMNV